MPVPEIVEVGGDADIFQARTSVNVSGGMFLITASGAASNSVALTGTVAVYNSNQVTATSVVASGLDKPLGLVLQDTASGTSSYVAFLRKGTVILRANVAVTANRGVAASAAAAASSGRIGEALATLSGLSTIGFAYTQAGSNEYAIIRLDM